MQEITLRAPAKLNLALDVVGVDQKGYHLLDMVMQNIALYDTLTLRRTQRGIGLTCDDSVPKGLDNIVVRAALRLQQYTGVDFGCEIGLKKDIPTQAGMGGGSADAAAVLLGLNQLWKLRLSMEELEDIGLTLGADVPFALRGGLARARGIGEKLTSLRGGVPLYFVCAKKKGGLSTQAVYQTYDALEEKPPRLDMEAFCRALDEGDWDALRASGGNALAPAAFTLEPGIRRLLDKLYETGALYAQMTGSGSAVFGMYADQVAALDALPTMEKEADWLFYAAGCQGVS
ncbi:MAG: 4-(cytidine 5'-diphospho)-2-C-methyl-D-erythritol kinase [Eubacteriales bacterium]|nr:4-(cytidine 5'-diphospho)-2-C-methyl-D-erythritol kinase [Eubacteriales bacterium]